MKSIFKKFPLSSSVGKLSEEMYRAGFVNEKLAFPFNSDGIIYAISLISESGSPGTVLLAPATYTIDKDIPMQRGVSLVGVLPNFTFTGDVPDSAFFPQGGTLFNCSPGVVALKWNNVAQGSIPADLAPTGVGAGKIYGITFFGGKRHIDTGASNTLGLQFWDINEVYSYDCEEWGYNFENFMHCSFGNIRQRNSIPGGGIRFADTLDATLMPGNSCVYGDIFSFTTDRRSRSIVFEAIGGTGNTFNQFNVSGRLQANRFGVQSTLAISAALTNGSSTITIADATQYDNCRIGMPLVFAGATPGGFTQNFCYYVASRNDGAQTITLATQPLSTAAVSSTSDGNFTLTCGGFPGLEIHANSASLFTNCDFGHLDIECYYNICSISLRRTRTSQMLIAEVYSSQVKNTVVARDAGGLIECINIANLGRCDLDSSSSGLIFKYKLGGRRSLTAGETLVAARKDCTLVVTSATDVSLTIPADMPPNFDFDVIQGGAGRVTIATSGTSLTNRSGNTKTAGQWAKVSVNQNGVNSYILSGDTAV